MSWHCMTTEYGRTGAAGLPSACQGSLLWGLNTPQETMLAGDWHKDGRPVFINVSRKFCLG